MSANATSDGAVFADSIATNDSTATKETTPTPATPAAKTHFQYFFTSAALEASADVVAIRAIPIRGQRPPQNG